MLATSRGANILTMRLFMASVLAFAATNVHAQSPSRMPESITGYGGYRFGMSLDEARRVDKDAVEKQCDYVGAALCLEKEDTFFGERGRVDALFAHSGKRLIGVNITFDKPGGIERACKRAAETIVKALASRFGQPTKTEPGNAYWYARAGGVVQFVNLCIDDDMGMLIVSYRPSGSF